MPTSNSSLNSEPEQIFTFLISWIASTQECMAEHFRSLWARLRDSTLSFCEWMSDRLCCCILPETDVQQRPQNQPPKQTIVPDKSIPKEIVPQTNASRNPPNPEAPSSPEPKNPPTSPQQPQPTATAPTLMNTTQHTVSVPVPLKAPVPVDPPKIDFVETGSIFGDRKRPPIDASMLQLENGRFRSPGQSRTIQGPGGRKIRVSFLKGFPSIKSIDSSRSVQTVVSKGNSIRSNDIDEKFSMTSKQMSMAKSYKSYKSVNSSGSGGSD